MTVHYKQILSTDADISPRPSSKTKTPSSRVYRRFGKRLIDVTTILLAAPAILIIVAILAVLVAFDGGKPFYVQKRVGRNGRIYTMWKLRSMVSDADAKLETYLSQNPEARIEWDRDQKLKSDPRITAFGRFLRKSSLDELPQLWNVLKGEMSLVGPRPMMPSQMAMYPGTDYYDLLPGITGMWQVSARNNSSFADRARFDADYNQSLSLGTDIQLLKATVRVVLRATGH
ncbi:sugar transferase [Pseudorhodobacter sp. W20_MBD10_FR17]|uniref:sugar transferase n=1 Tax=Pseudorhodobacter sp. W20_MBD10_FR17 TaxID=3240266 RepID=UPI003F9B198B